MHSTTFFRAVMAAIVLLCCALVAFQQGRVRARPRMVTELVSVVYVPARPAPPPAAAPAPPGPSTATAVAAAAPVSDRPKAAAAPEHVIEARRPLPRITLARAAAGRVVAAAARANPSTHALKKSDKAGDPLVASAPPVPALFMPVRRLGLSLQRRLVQAGVLKVCAPPSGRTDDCVKPASDS
jgi:hypothetical protein